MRSSTGSVCFSRVTWIKTLTLAPSLTGSRRVTRRRITPASSSARTRARHGEGERPYLSCEVDIGEAAVILERGQDLNVDGVEPAHRHYMP